MRLPVGDPRFIDLLASWGAPYSYGAGKPSDGRDAIKAIGGWPDGVKGIGGGVGWDCSGWVQAALVRLRILPPTAMDRSAAALHDLAQPVAPGEEHLGDMAFYGTPAHVSHVMLVVAPGVVMGARGGDSKTNADNPHALVQLEPLKYWDAFLGCRRFVVRQAVAA